MAMIAMWLRVLRELQLLLLKVDVLQQLQREVAGVAGGPDAARKLVLQDPKVGPGAVCCLLACVRVRLQLDCCF
jgi:hypothetical protein